MSLWQMENLGRRESVKTISEDAALGMARFSWNQGRAEVGGGDRILWRIT